MRMIGCPHGTARRVLLGSHLVEEEEGVDQLEAALREGTVDFEPATFQGIHSPDDVTDVSSVHRK